MQIAGLQNKRQIVSFLIVVSFSLKCFAFEFTQIVDSVTKYITEICVEI